MGCNCGKSKHKFKALINNAPKITRAERIKLRKLRIEARNQRIAIRNAKSNAKKD